MMTELNGKSPMNRGIPQRIITVCAQCGKLRLAGCDPLAQTSWVDVRRGDRPSTAHRISHGLCPDCCRDLYGEEVCRSL